MEVAVSRKFFAFTPSMPLVLGWIRFLFDSNSSSLTYWSHIFLKNDKIIQFLILRNRHSTIKAILTARFGEVEVAVGRKFNCALTVVLCREWRLELRPIPPWNRLRSMFWSMFWDYYDSDSGSGSFPLRSWYQQLSRLQCWNRLQEWSRLWSLYHICFNYNPKLVLFQF